MAGNQKRLCRFMFRKLEDGSCPGVEWMDKSKGVFKIPWYHINKVETKDLPNRFKIFVEWANYTGKYQEGSGEPDYTTFKTQLRCALKKIPDFEEVKEGDTVEKNTAHPYKLYRFTEWISKEEAQSPDSTFVDVNVNYSLGERIYMNLPNFLEGNEAQSLSNVNVESECGLFNVKEDGIDFLADSSVPNVEEIQQWPCFSGTTQSETYLQQQGSCLPEEVKSFPQQFDYNQVLQNCTQQQINQTQDGQSMHSHNVFGIQLEHLESLHNFQRSNLLPQNSSGIQPQASNYLQIGQNQDPFVDLKPQATNYLQMEQNQEPTVKMGERQATNNTQMDDNQQYQLSTSFIPYTLPQNTGVTLEELDPIQQAMLMAHIQEAKISTAGSLPETDYAQGNSLQADDDDGVMQDFKYVLTENGLGSLDMAEVDSFGSQIPDNKEIPMVNIGQPQPPQGMAMSASNGSEISEGSATIAPVDQELKMKVVVYYGKPKVKVMEEEVGEKGCRLYFGERVFDNTPLDENMYGPKTVQQLHLPSIEDLPLEAKNEFSKLKKIENQSNVITTTLKSMNRGVVLQFENGDIFAKRLCKCTVFVCDAKHNTKKLERNSTVGTKVFDFEYFKQLCYNEKPPSHFYLTFGREAESSKPDPLERVLLTVEITHRSAHDMVASSHLMADNNLSSMDVMMSDPNSMDQLEDKFKVMALKNAS